MPQSGLYTARRPLALAPGPHLFLDDYLIAESHGLRRVTHPPKKLPDPVVPHDRPVYYMKVLYDPALGRYRMWYNAMGPIFGYAYAESDDAISWELPDLGLLGGNYVAAPTGHWSLFLVDEGPGYTDPARRYKMAYYVGHNQGMCVAFSPDGMRFTEYEGNPVIHASVGDKPWGAPGYENIIGDILDGCWDPHRGEYLLGCKIEQSGYPGKPHHHAEGWRRCVGMSTSQDFVAWDRPRLIVTPEPDHGLEEFYGFKPIIRGDLYIGFLRVLRDDLPATPGGAVEGIGWTELLTSRDGRHWTRHPETFIDRDLREDRWDHAMAWFGDCLTVGDYDYVYYGGYRAGHKIRATWGDRSLGMGILRKNGFVSRDAGAEGGTLRTPPAELRVPADARLTVNAVVRDELRVRLVGADGQPLPGFDWADSAPVRGDALAHRIAWRGDPPLPVRRTVSVEFALRNTELYGFEL